MGKSNDDILSCDFFRKYAKITKIIGVAQVHDFFLLPTKYIVSDRKKQNRGYMYI
jgi:hypothetical protein